MRFLPILVVAAVAAAILVAAPAGHAHSSTVLLDNEVLLLSDETSDQFAVYDGYDIVDLSVREAHWRATGQDGLIFRLNLYGGAGLLDAGSSRTVDVLYVVDGEDAGFSVTTVDDLEWTTDAILFDVSVEEEQPAYNAQLQVFTPFLNATPETVSEFRVHSYAGGSMVDIAPGSYFLPVAGDLGPAVDLPFQESAVVTAAIAPAGPIGYTNTTATVDGAAIHLAVGNQISVVGQHVLVVPREHAAWAIIGDLQTEAQAGEDVAFNLTLQPIGAPDTLTLDIHSDLGGLETLHFAWNGESFGPEASDDTEDSPGAGLVLSGFAMVAAAVLALRRRD